MAAANIPTINDETLISDINSSFVKVYHNTSSSYIEINDIDYVHNNMKRGDIIIIVDFDGSKEYSYEGSNNSTVPEENTATGDDDTPKGKRKTKSKSKKRKTRKVKTRKTKKRRTRHHKKRKSRTRRN